MQTLKKTTVRSSPVYLRAEHDDAGPYYLTDRAGYGVVWRKPALYAGETDGKPTWIPVFRRALLAFEMLELDDSITPAEAKSVSDKLAPAMEAMIGRIPMEHAIRMVEASRKKSKK